MQSQEEDEGSKGGERAAGIERGDRQAEEGNLPINGCIIQHVTDTGMYTQLLHFFDHFSLSDLT